MRVHRSTSRVVSAVVAGALALTGVAVGAGVAQAGSSSNGVSVQDRDDRPKPDKPHKPGKPDRPDDSVGQPGNPTGDTWLESVVTRTVTPEAQEAFDAEVAEARAALSTAMEEAGRDSEARDAAKATFRTSVQAAVAAFDAATLPADQVQPVADYRAAVAAAHVAKAEADDAAKAAFKAARAEAKSAFKAAKAAATTPDERRAAAKDYRAAVKAANQAHREAKSAARADKAAAIQAARDALVAALIVPSPTPAS